MQRRFKVRRSRQQDVAELNITAFLNLMVILVPFLLITAVFSRMSILELNLPDPSSDMSDDLPIDSLELEIIVNKNGLLVTDRNTGPLKRIQAVAGEQDLKALSQFLRRVKIKFPDKIDATLLLGPDVDYATLVAVMDAVRVLNLDKEGVIQQYQLFPRIAVGDAPINPRVAGVN